MTDLQYTEFLRRSVLVHSYIYYELNANVIEDYRYDKLAAELVVKQKDKDNQRGMYWDIFMDFDGSTGFDLYHRLNEYDKDRIKSISILILNTYNSDGKAKGNIK
jgi:hypothetical protein